MRRVCHFAWLLILGATVCSAQSFRGFWADAFSVGFKSNAEVTSMVSRAVAGRYNAIVVEVLAFHDNVGGGHGAYWNSAIVPRATDVSPASFDSLAAVISQAHAAGLEVHAWIVPYRVSSAWPPSGNALLAGHPEWLMVPQANLGGGPARVGSYYTLDPGSPDAQEYLTSIVRELVSNYAIDGVNLDYIRYVQTDAGYPAVSTYADSTLERFRRRTGFSGVPAPTGNTAWNDFRRRTIDEYVRRLRAEIPSIPNARQPLRFSADLICFGNAPANFTSSDAYLLHQNWQMWMQNGWLDLGIPMNYKREHNATEAQWYRNWVNASINWRYQRHVASGQGNYLNTKANSITQMSYALTQGSNGCVNFSYDATADEDRNGTPEADWNWYPYVGANLFTATTPTPPMPWRNPATATEGTLWGRVTNGETGEPVEFATVQVGALGTIETDGNGYYVKTLIPATAAGTNYSVSATGAGCPTVTHSGVAVVAGLVARSDFVLCPVDPPPGDMDQDGDVDAGDLASFIFCLQGPGFFYGPGQFCLRGDTDADSDVDMRDFRAMQAATSLP
ncbi:MAG: family 10 glycosylhydrolase [Phycisphaerales bacterium]|nr:family 10 glycosylhydrolase [Phycisphaerales bacterium]